jgi:predicted DNA-binding transcriptional regulator YafY
MRNAEVVRQWNLLQALAASRHGQTIDQLAELAGVTTRTIRRDLEALSVAGFPIYDDVVEGRRRWMVEGHPFAAMREKGFTVQEVCAIYFSRSLLETLAGTPFQRDLETAFAKIERTLTPAMRAFLDRVPALLTTKREPAASRATRNRDQTMGRLLDAVLFRRKATITYWSFSSRRVRTYRIHPYRVAYGLGALYLSAYVEDYRQVRTFAFSRIRQVSVHEEHFSRDATLDRDAFANSLGIHEGQPVHVEIEFSAEIAPYIREREWHPSQRLTDSDDGRVMVVLDVCDDWALRSWILGFGPRARVLAPTALAERVRADLEGAAARYADQLAGAAAGDLQKRLQRLLPFWTDRAIS